MNQSAQLTMTVDRALRTLGCVQLAIAHTPFDETDRQELFGVANQLVAAIAEVQPDLADICQSGFDPTEWVSKTEITNAFGEAIGPIDFDEEF